MEYWRWHQDQATAWWQRCAPWLLRLASTGAPAKRTSYIALFFKKHTRVPHTRALLGGMHKKYNITKSYKRKDDRDYNLASLCAAAHWEESTRPKCSRRVKSNQRAHKNKVCRKTAPYGKEMTWPAQQTRKPINTGMHF